MQCRLSSLLGLRSSALALALCFAAGCEAAPVAGAACDRASDCSSPLVCSYARCRVECRETRDCPIGARCIASAGLGVCTLAAESQCDTEVCPAPLLCVADQCRTECSTNAQCISGNCVMSTCVEPVSGVDAGTPDDASVGTADAYVVPDAGLGGCAPAPTASVTALVGPATGRGLRATFRTVADVSPASPPALAVSATRTSGLAGSYVATIDGPVPLLFHATSDADPFIPVTPWTTAQETQAWSIDAVIDEDKLLVMFMRQPATDTDAFAWAIDTLTTDAPTVYGLSPNRDITGETFHGELAIVGGGSPFGGPSMGVYYVFHTELGGVGTIGATDRTRSGGAWREPAAFPAVFGSPVIEMTTTHGPLVVFRDPTSGAVGYWRPELWDSGVATPTAGTADVVTLRTAGVLPGLASSLDGSTSILAWAAGNAVELEQITCVSDACGAPTVLETVAAGSSAVVAVAMTALADGYALAVGRVGGTVDVFLFDDEPRMAAPFAAVSTFAGSTSDETIRRLDLTATPTDAGATVLLGVISDEASIRHVWTASYEVCDLP